LEHGITCAIVQSRYKGDDHPNLVRESEASLIHHYLGDDHDHYKSERTGADGWYMWWSVLASESYGSFFPAMPEVQLNYGYSAKLHCDKNNLGPSFIIGWGLPRMNGG